MAGKYSKLTGFILPAALGLPILILLGMIFMNYTLLLQGRTYRFPISGYDPRDVLSGHYVIYRIEFPGEPCAGFDDFKNDEEECLCLTSPGPEAEGYLIECSDRSQECLGMIRGRCEGSRFVTGLEKYFIPESRAAEFDRVVRSGQASILVVAKENGEALVKDLILPVPYLEAGDDPAESPPDNR